MLGHVGVALNELVERGVGLIADVDCGAGARAFRGAIESESGQALWASALGGASSHSQPLALFLAVSHGLFA